MAKEYVTVKVEKRTGYNVHPDDTTLEGRIYGIAVWAWSDESHLADFIQARAGRDGFDNDGNRIVTVTTTPKELQKIRSASQYQAYRNA